jgi:DNA-binding Xre family transcriptional regulator
MRKTIDYRWHLRQVMATRGMFQTTDLVPLLAERGIELSREQVYRLVVNTPERLNLRVLAALCDILECGAEQLFEPVAESAQVRKEATKGTRAAATKSSSLRPPRARLVK